MEKRIEQVAEGIANSCIAVAAGVAVGILLGGHQLVVAEAEDTGVAVVDEGHRPGAAETITNQELTATLLEHIIAAVLQLHLVAVLSPLAHLFEQARAVEDSLAAAGQAAESCIARNLGLAWAQIAIGVAKELLGEPGSHTRLTPAVIPAGALGDAASLACAQAEVAAAGLAEVVREMVGGLLAIHVGGDPDGGAVAVVAGFTHRIAHHPGARVGQAGRLGQGSAADD